MAPRYSVLLPTRNGASLLEDCVRSILEQPYADLELIVSDNASQDGTREILERFAGDPRLEVVELAEAVDVTANWNVALARSRGERILLVGDDDLLLPGYFDRVDALFARHDDPDVLSYNAYAYAYPGFSGSAESHYADPFFETDPRVPRDGEIPPALRREIVAEMFHFVFPLALNMQTVVVSRRALDCLPAGLFREPFPDFYAINGLLLRCERWVNVEERLLVVGVSPKSFGRTLHSSSEQARGVGYLGIQTGFVGSLPGSEFLNGTHRCLLALQADFPAELAGLAIDRPEYVIQQAYAWYVQWRLGSLRPRQVLAMLRLLGSRDWPPLLRMLAARLHPAKLSRRLRIDRADPAPQLWPGMRPLPGVSDIAQFAAWVGARER
jgi:hypothetical protein